MKNHSLLAFCGVALLLVGPGCAHAAVAPAPLAVPQTIATVTERAGDKFILAGGAGTKDGSSWANAMDAAKGLQAGWDALQAGQTLWIGSGNYPDAKLIIKSGGEASKLKTIAGKDTGGGAPVFPGTFDKDNPAKSGSTFITLMDGADYWSVQDIHIRDYNLGIASKAGGHQGARIRNFDVTGSREGISLFGGATPENSALGSHDIDIADCEFTHFTKRGIRLRNGNYDIRITNCVADAGGKEWATEPFHMGFSVEGDGAASKAKVPGAFDHDILYTNCVALNSYHNNGPKYWNADGFCGELGVDNVRFVNCMAFDNTDGGWDYKSENVTLENCVAVGNKRNYRFWGKTTKLINCLAAYSVYPGGNGDDIGLWTNGNVSVVGSSFYNNKITVDPGGKVVMTNSLLVRGKDSIEVPAPGKGPNLTITDSVMWDEATGQGTNPQLVAPVAMWEGQGSAFNNKKFGTAKGYSNANTVALPFHRTLPIPRGQVPVKVAEVPVVEAPKTPEQIALEAKMVAVVENGGFEDDLTGWQGAKAPIYQLKAEGAAQEKKYLTVTTDKRVDAKGKIDGLVRGETYVLSFQSRGNTSPDARIIPRQSASGPYLGMAKPSPSPTWTPSSIKFVAPSSEIFIELSVRAPGTFDLDDFTVKRAN